MQLRIHLIEDNGTRVEYISIVTEETKEKAFADAARFLSALHELHGKERHLDPQAVAELEEEEPSLSWEDE